MKTTLTEFLHDVMVGAFSTLAVLVPVLWLSGQV